MWLLATILENADKIAINTESSVDLSTGLSPSLSNYKMEIMITCISELWRYGINYMKYPASKLEKLIYEWQSDIDRRLTLIEHFLCASFCCIHIAYINSFILTTVLRFSLLSGWDSWMASLTQWTWVWANSGREWKTGKPDVLQFMGLQRVRHDLATEQQFYW